MQQTIELRLVKLAKRIADIYKDRIELQYYEQLCNAIKVCEEYHVNGRGDWGDMYDVVLYDDGIWEYACCSWFEEEIQNMWALVTDILICNCYLGCVGEQDSTPQDMEIQEESMPEFVDLLESLIHEKIDYDEIFEFWNKKMCY